MIGLFSLPISESFGCVRKKDFCGGRWWNFFPCCVLLDALCLCVVTRNRNQICENKIRCSEKKAASSFLWFSFVLLMDARLTHANSDCCESKEQEVSSFARKSTALCSVASNLCQSRLFCDWSMTGASYNQSALSQTLPLPSIKVDQDPNGVAPKFRTRHWDCDTKKILWQNYTLIPSNHSHSTEKALL